MVKTYIVNLNSIVNVKEFVEIVSSYIGNFDLISGRYVIDAKSIMGVFSLDLSKDVELRVYLDKEVSTATFEDIEKSLSKFIIKEKE